MLNALRKTTRAIRTKGEPSVRSLSGLPARVVESVVNAICQHPAVRSAVSTDQREPGFINSPLVDYLGAFVDEELVGVFLVIEASDLERDLHALLLPEAIAHSRVLGRACINHVFNSTGVRRVTAYVSSARPSTINYCKRLGFVSEGIRRNAESRNGFLFDVHTLGMTRSDWIGG